MIYIYFEVYIFTHTYICTRWAPCQDKIPTATHQNRDLVIAVCRRPMISALLTQQITSCVARLRVALCRRWRSWATHTWLRLRSSRNDSCFFRFLCFWLCEAPTASYTSSLFDTLTGAISLVPHLSIHAWSTIFRGRTNVKAFRYVECLKHNCSLILCLPNAAWPRQKPTKNSRSGGKLALSTSWASQKADTAS